ncbi:HesA/MoeB/ThiF family protein [Marinomonas transparens]|uniref:HesA/MoeB/ThiF family protein n=1 Tax=Marinomonas transparens TaxID=2795388 RepID=A0A934MY10_9GAMM|nr:HesA/MoeB/ThiF family protein [Marinomonas transparens]MBJ7539904.1 HesA/MoeB/ThiF family protein [Marinomonas transparens]
MEERYSRQIPIMGKEGIEKLKNSKVFVGRCGGVGGTVVNYLIRAGVGNLICAHGGKIVPEYLNRMQLAYETDVGKSCIDAFRDKTDKINSQAKIHYIDNHITDIDNIEELLSDVDLVVDAHPLFEERYKLNDLALKLDKPMVSGAMYGDEGYVFTVLPHKTACLRCLYPKKPDFWTNIKVFPALGMGPGIIGCSMAREAIELLLKGTSQLSGKTLHFDLADMDFSVLNMPRKECNH